MRLEKVCNWFQIASPKGWEHIEVQLRSLYDPVVCEPRQIPHLRFQTFTNFLREKSATGENTNLRLGLGMDNHMPYPTSRISYNEHSTPLLSYAMESRYAINKAEEFRRGQLST